MENYTTTDKNTAGNMGLAKAGGQWLIERLCFLFTLVLGDSEVLLMPAFAKPRTVSTNTNDDIQKHIDNSNNSDYNRFRYDFL